MKICKVDGCENDAKSLGLCGKHLMRFKRHGHTEKHERMHGLSGGDIYSLWSNIKKMYGVSEEWETFLTFFHDIGDRPSYDHKLKRIDVSMPYSKTNFKWVCNKKE